MSIEIEFPKPKPKRPFHDFRAWSLLLPAAASAIGFFAFAVLAFSFTEMSTLSRSFRTSLVVIGAFALAIGGELGTLTNTIEVFRKSKKDAQYESATKWDWAGLVVSLAATMGEFLIAFAALLGVKVTWSLPFQLWGPIALGLLSALDAYVGFMEVGLYLAEHDKRYKIWVIEYQKFLKGEYFASQPSAQAGESVQPAVEDAKDRAQPRATVANWRAIYADLNGNRAELDAATVEELVIAAGFAPPSRRTMQNWAKEAQRSPQAPISQQEGVEP